MANNEIEQVREVLERYAEGTYKANIELLRSVFHPQAHMTGFLGDQVLIGTPEPFFEDMASAPSMESNGDPFKADIRDINVVGGRIATAVVHETGFRGSAEFEDHMQLMLTDGKWLIISKNFTSLSF